MWQNISNFLDDCWMKISGDFQNLELAKVLWNQILIHY